MCVPEKTLRKQVLQKIKKNRKESREALFLSYSLTPTKNCYTPSEQAFPRKFNAQTYSAALAAGQPWFHQAFGLLFFVGLNAGFQDPSRLVRRVQGKH
jgi:hypothetical protein